MLTSALREESPPPPLFFFFKCERNSEPSITATSSTVFLNSKPPRAVPLLKASQIQHCLISHWGSRGQKPLPHSQICTLSFAFSALCIYKQMQQQKKNPPIFFTFLLGLRLRWVQMLKLEPRWCPVAFNQHSASPCLQKRCWQQLSGSTFCFLFPSHRPVVCFALNTLVLNSVVILSKLYSSN